MHSNFVNNLISVLMLLTPYDEIFICLSLPYRLSKVFKLEKCFNFEKSFLYQIQGQNFTQIFRTDAGTPQLAGSCASTTFLARNS